MIQKIKKSHYFLIALFIAACTTQPKDPAASDAPKPLVATDSSARKTSGDPFIKNGEEKVRYSNGVIKTLGNYKKGKRDGQWYSWYSTGKPWSETYFDNGIKNGPTKSWYGNGQLRYEGQYTNDAESGVWKYYEESGKLVKTMDNNKK